MMFKPVLNHFQKYLNIMFKPTAILIPVEKVSFLKYLINELLNIALATSEEVIVESTPSIITSI